MRAHRWCSGSRERSNEEAQGDWHAIATTKHRSRRGVAQRLVGLGIPPPDARDVRPRLFLVRDVPLRLRCPSQDQPGDVGLNLSGGGQTLHLRRWSSAQGSPPSRRHLVEKRDPDPEGPPATVMATGATWVDQGGGDLAGYSRGNDQRLRVQHQAEASPATDREEDRGSRARTPEADTSPRDVGGAARTASGRAGAPAEADPSARDEPMISLGSGEGCRFTGACSHQSRRLPHFLHTSNTWPPCSTTTRRNWCPKRPQYAASLGSVSPTVASSSLLSGFGSIAAPYNSSQGGGRAQPYAVPSCLPLWVAPEGRVPFRGAYLLTPQTPDRRR